MKNSKNVLPKKSSNKNFLRKNLKKSKKKIQKKIFFWKKCVSKNKKWKSSKLCFLNIKNCNFFWNNREKFPKNMFKKLKSEFQIRRNEFFFKKLQSYSNWNESSKLSLKECISQKHKRQRFLACFTKTWLAIFDLIGENP